MERFEDVSPLMVHVVHALNAKGRRPAAARPRCAGLLAVSITLAGCGTVFDPAPYDPRVPSDAQADPACPISGGTAQVSAAGGTPGADSPLDHFDSLPDARACLEKLAIGYAREHNGAAQQQLAFDLPVIGMGIAAIANPVFHGANAATVALGLGTAGVEGGKLYFSPGIRAAAYESAAQTLFCASGVAAQLSFVEHPTSPLQAPDVLASALETTIRNAQSGTTSAALAAAIVPAQMALTNLRSARVLLAYAPSALQAYAQATISGATRKLTTGTQDLNAVLNQIKATQTAAGPVSAAGGATTAGPSPVHGLAFLPDIMTAEQKLAILVEQTAEAEALAKAINDDWKLLDGCTALQP